MPSRIHPVALLASVVGLLALGKLPFFHPSWFVFKANRLLEGSIHTLDVVGMGVEWLFLLWLCVLVISIVPFKQRVWLLALSVCAIVIVTLLSLEQGVEVLTGDLEGRALQRARVSLSSGVWLTALAVYILIFATVQSSTTALWHKVVMLSPTVVAVAWLVARGTLADLGISQELAKQGTDFYTQVAHHLALSLTSVFLASLIGIPAAIIAVRKRWLERLILPSVALLQTVPSLALFGFMLAPLSRLGKQWQGWQFFALLMVTLLVAMLLYWVQGRTRGWKKLTLMSFNLVIIGIPSILFFVVLALFVYACVVAVATGNSELLYTFGDFTRMSFTDIGARFSASVPLWSEGQTQLADIGVRGIGSAPALIALTLYALLPIVRNTYTGLKEVPQSVVEAGRGMGMSQRQILRRVELPLAFPLLMEGVRASMVLTIGIATVVFLIGAEGLGSFIQQGIDQVVPDLVLLGAIPIIFLALLADGMLRVVGHSLTPKGIR